MQAAVGNQRPAINIFELEIMEDKETETDAIFGARNGRETKVL